MASEYINISAEDGENIWYTVKEIKQYAIDHAHELLHAYMRYLDNMEVIVVASHRGWITGVTTKGQLIQEWAGEFSIAL